MPRVLFVAAALVSILGAAVTSGAAESSKTAEIVFSTNRAPDLWRAAVISIRPDGTRRKVLARGIPGISEVRTSLDSRRLLFVDGGLFVATADGRHVTRLTRPGLYAQLSAGAVLSSDGRYVAFAGSKQCDNVCDYEVYVVRSDGRGLRLIGPGLHPSWSPDGRRLVFERESPSAVYVASRRGAVRRLVSGEDPVWAPRGQRIAFVRRGSTEATCLVNADGVQRRCISTFGAGTEIAWSPDARKIAFVSGGLVVVSAAGRHARSLTENPVDRSPIWSPDSRRLAYVHVDHPSSRIYLEQIYVRSANGRASAHRTTSEPRTTSIDNVRWTGKRITYTAFLQRNDHEIAVMDPRGGHLRILTRNDDDDVEPAWSPDRRRIAYSRIVPGEDGVDRGSLRVIGADGSNDRVLADAGQLDDSSPAWSPDGKQIAFVRRDPAGGWMGTLDVLTVASGEIQVLVNDPPLQPGRISWSPDGSRIVFAATPNEPIGSDLFTVHSDGSSLTRLRTACYWALSPVWSPDGSAISFTGTCGTRGGVFTTATDGSGVSFVAETRDPAGGATWAADSAHLMFAAQPCIRSCDTRRIVSVRTDGKERRAVMTDFSSNRDPMWDR